MTMTANPDFDAEKAKADAARVYHSGTMDWAELRNALGGLLRAEELSRRPAGDLGKLVEELKGDCYCEDCVDQERTAVGDTGSVGVCLHCRAADALTALSSAPVDAGVALKCKAWLEYADGLDEIGQTFVARSLRSGVELLRTLSRQLTTERQAIEKVRAEIEAKAQRDLPLDEYFKRERAARAEATCRQSLQVAEPTKDAAHEVAELLWSELYGVRRWVMDQCATDLNEIVWDVLKFYHEHHIDAGTIAVTDEAVERIVNRIVEKAGDDEHLHPYTSLTYEECIAMVRATLYAATEAR